MEDKKDIQQAAMHNVQNIYGTQINIGKVEGHYIEHVDTLIIGKCREEKANEPPKEPRKEYAVEILFGDAETNRKQAERFNRFLAGQGLTGTPLNSAQTNPVNKAFVAVYRHLLARPTQRRCLLPLPEGRLRPDLHRRAEDLCQLHPQGHRHDVRQGTCRGDGEGGEGLSGINVFS